MKSHGPRPVEERPTMEEPETEDAGVLFDPAEVFGDAADETSRFTLASTFARTVQHVHVRVQTCFPYFA